VNARRERTVQCFSLSELMTQRDGYDLLRAGGNHEENR